jgi:hypothetical protein
MSTFTIRELLHGTKPGRMQSVGLMQVIPLVLTSDDLASDNFATPAMITADTLTNYGCLGFQNRDADRPAIIPMHAAIITKTPAQDHTMVKAGLVDKGARRVFNDACCIQETQPGQFHGVDGKDIQILPYALRETALRMRGNRTYNKLWPAIRSFNVQTKSSTAGNLVAFEEKYARVIDQFVAEFENIPGQIGAIVMVDGKLLGVERAPNLEYWLAVWEPLIRLCYGSQAVIATIGKTTGASPQTASAAVAIMSEDITSLDELENAVKSAIQSSEDAARKVVRDLIDDEFVAEVDDTMRVIREGHSYEVKVWNLEHDQFVGQAITDDGTVVYASMTSKAGWERRRAVKKAPAFSL